MNDEVFMDGNWGWCSICVRSVCPPRISVKRIPTSTGEPRLGSRSGSPVRVIPVLSGSVRSGVVGGKDSFLNFSFSLPVNRARWRSRSGFTLVELLVVIAIVGILAALLFPAFKGGTQKAMAAKGTSNLRQLAQAQMQYASDTGGAYTPLWVSGDFSWQVYLAPYLGIDHPNKYDTVFWNGLRMDPHSVFNMPDSTPISQRAAGATSIGMNAKITDSNNWNRRVVAVAKPSQTILLGEMPRDENSDSATPMNAGSNYYLGFNRSGRTRVLMVFCDGHAAAFAPALLGDDPTTRPTGEPDLWRWW